MNKRIFFVAAGFAVMTLAFVTGCVKDVGKLPATSPPVAANFCDTISYSKHVKPIIANGCSTQGCHDNGSLNGDYTTYAGLLIKVNNGSFKSRVFNKNNPMPASGLLPKEQLDVLQCWLDKGALDN